jgi:hypothetical protein
MSQDEAMEWATFLAALKGKAAAIKEMAGWIMEYQGGAVEYPPKSAIQPIEMVTARHPSNADEALQLLEIVAAYAGKIGLTCIPLLLEPWAAQAAISRRRGGSRLTDRDRDDICRLTRDPDSLRWPRGTDQ